MTTPRPVKIGLLYGLDPEREYWSEEHSKVLRDEAIERLKHAPAPVMHRPNLFRRIIDWFRDVTTVELRIDSIVEQSERPYIGERDE